MMSKAIRRRTAMILLAGAMLLMLSAGAALAKTLQCVVNVECRGTDKADRITGTNDNDTVPTGTFFGDVIFGLDGNDTIVGEASQAGFGENDFMSGGSGDDTITDKSSIDAEVIKGGRGNDRIDVKAGDASIDKVDCGKGRDTVFFDVDSNGNPIDEIKNCERKNPK